MGGAAYNYSDNMGNRMESRCHVESRTKQSFDMVHMHNGIQYGRNSSNHISAYTQDKSITMSEVPILCEYRDF